MNNLMITKITYIYVDEKEIEYIIEKIRNTCYIKKVSHELWLDNGNFMCAYIKPNIQFKCKHELTDEIIEHELHNRDRRYKIYSNLEKAHKHFNRIDIKI